MHLFSSTFRLYVTPGKSFYTLRLVFSLLKMRDGIPAQLASHSCYGTTNKIISGKRTKDPLERWLIPKLRQGKFRGDKTLSLCQKAGNVQKLMESEQKDIKTSLKVKFETV